MKMNDGLLSYLGQLQVSAKPKKTKRSTASKRETYLKFSGMNFTDMMYQVANTFVPVAKPTSSHERFKKQAEESHLDSVAKYREVLAGNFMTAKQVASELEITTTSAADTLKVWSKLDQPLTRIVGQKGNAFIWEWIGK